MGWRLFNAHESFGSLRDYWDAINRETGNHILLDSLFWQPLLDNFGSGRVCVAVNDGNAGKGVALVETGKHGFWYTFQPSQAPLGPILFDAVGSARLSEQITGLISDLPGYALGFSVTQQDPDFTCFADLNGVPSSETLDYIQTPRLRISGSFEDYWKGRSKNLKHNLSRQRRRLQENGVEIKLVTNRQSGSVAKAVEEYGRLEIAGWKAQEGTAVGPENAQGQFYRQILDNFCDRGEGVIYRLLLDGRMVACDMCLERNGTTVILKTAYDESVQGLSLGLLLHLEIFRSLFDEGRTQVIEFYGPVRDWHTKWTNEIRTLYHVNFYRFGWLPAARRILKRATGNRA